jgi:hypothetical protein
VQLEIKRLGNPGQGAKFDPTARLLDLHELRVFHSGTCCGFAQTQSALCSSGDDQVLEVLGEDDAFNQGVHLAGFADGSRQVLWGCLAADGLIGWQQRDLCEGLFRCDFCFAFHGFTSVSFGALACSSGREDVVSVHPMPCDVGGAFQEFDVGGRARFDFGGAQVKFLIVSAVEVDASTARFAAATGGFQLENGVAGDAVQVSARGAVDEQVFEHFADGPHSEEFAFLGEGSHVADEWWFALEVVGVVRVSDDGHIGSLGLTTLVCQGLPDKRLSLFSGRFLEGHDKNVR